MLSNPSSCAQHTVRPNKQKCRSLEQQKGYCRAKRGEQVALAQKHPELPDGFWEKVVIGKIWGEGCRCVTFFWSVGGEVAGRCSRNLVFREVTILHLGGGLSSSRRAQRYCHVSIYPLRRNQDPALSVHCCSLTVPPLFLHSLPSIISSCLNLPFGNQGPSRQE